MGNCSSNETTHSVTVSYELKPSTEISLPNPNTEELISYNIEKHLKEEFADEKFRLKFLLLGPGESGKTTVVKQMTHVYGSGFPPDRAKPFVAPIRTNCFDSIITLLKYHEKFVERNLVPEISLDSISSKQFILQHLENFGDVYHEVENLLVTPEIANCITILWDDVAIQETYKLRNRFQLPFAVDYFFPRVDIIAMPDYIPSFDDIVRARVRTTGANFINFKFQDTKCMIVDVGGQRAERRKWINCFDDVDAIIFIAAISEYDESVFENGVDLRYCETFSLWQWTVNLNQLKDISMILFLNKIDLFEDKLKRVPLKDSPFFEKSLGLPELENYPIFSDYCEACKKFVLARFLEKVSDKERHIYPHFTCATDTKAINAVMVGVKNTILRLQFENSGLN